MPMVANMQPTTMTVIGTCSNPYRLPTGYSATRTHTTTAADRISWRASSTPAWRHIRP